MDTRESPKPQQAQKSQKRISFQTFYKISQSNHFIDIDYNSYRQNTYNQRRL